jgi:CHAD domain-containing protein
VATCLLQILGNSGEIAAGRGTPEHLHQLRVGLRRLRALLRLFEGRVTLPDPSWPAQVAALFQALGAQRDRDVLSDTLLPALRDAGAPLAQLPDSPSEPAAEGPAARLRAPACNRLLLALLGFAIGAPLPASAAATATATVSASASEAAATGRPDPIAPLALDPWLDRQLSRWHRQIARDADRFGQLDEAARHRLRKRIKRLRYAAELASARLPGGRLARYLAALAPAQQALGELNDLAVARQCFADAAASDPRAWFAAGWLSAQHDAQRARCEAPLRALRRARLPRIRPRPESESPAR